VPNEALDRAYCLSKRIRSIQIYYLWYSKLDCIHAENTEINTYINVIMEAYVFDIYWALLKCQITEFLIKHIWFIFFFSDPRHILQKLNNQNQAEQLQSDFAYFWNRDHSISTEKKKVWMKCLLYDLDCLKKDTSNHATWHGLLYNLHYEQFSGVLKKSIKQNIAYEAIGFVPRSITRTLIRFHKELFNTSRSIVLCEFRLIKYQAIASIQYLCYLFFIPWICSYSFQSFFLESILNIFWNEYQIHFFLNLAYEKKALIELQQIEEFIWLNSLFHISLDTTLDTLSHNIEDQTLELIRLYNKNSIESLNSIITNILHFFFICIILIWGKKRLAILNSWIQEMFYSLSDTMKAFWILLLTDLCIGFHSPHGWEIFIAWFVKEIGFINNQYLISFLVSTFPVILDTILKYWIFRHLNRLSPSIVVTYHAMNE
jgi:hypothetical protein